jgi:hypothetical protein
VYSSRPWTSTWRYLCVPSCHGNRGITYYGEICDYNTCVAVIKGPGL